eukprot:287430_1
MLEPCVEPCMVPGGHSAIRFSQPNDSPQLQPPPQITVAIAAKNACKLKYNPNIAEILENEKHTKAIGKYIRKSHKARKELKEVDGKCKAPCGLQLRWTSKSKHQTSIYNAMKPLRTVIPYVSLDTAKKTRVKLEAAVDHFKNFLPVKLLAVTSDINLTITHLVHCYEAKDLQFDDFEGFLTKQIQVFNRLKDEPGKYETKFNASIQDIDEKQTTELEQALEAQQKELRKAMKTSQSIAEQERLAAQQERLRQEFDQQVSQSVEQVQPVSQPVIQQVLRRSARIAQQDADRESDVLYDWTDEDEDEEAVHPNEEAVHPNDAIKTNVCFAGSNIILYERSRSAEARVQKIKEDYIDTLVEQLKLKVVLAKKIALFKFLSPHYIVMTCTELDNEFKIEDYDLFTSDEQIIEYLNRIKYGESHIDKIRIIFPDLMDYDALKQEWTAHRHHVFIGHLKDLGYKQFWSQYLRNDGWTEANPDLTILALVLVVICL